MKKKKICPWCGKGYSHKGKYCCPLHSKLAMEDVNRQLQEKEGPIYDKWKKNLEASLKPIAGYRAKTD